MVANLFVIIFICLSQTQSSIACETTHLLVKTSIIYNHNTGALRSFGKCFQFVFNTSPYFPFA